MAYLNTIEELRVILKNKCRVDPARVLDVTPYLPHRDSEGKRLERGHEIQKWLDDNTGVPEESVLTPNYQVSDFMIIDDDRDMAHLKETNFLHIDGDLGLTIKDCRKLIKRLREPGNPVKEKMGDW